MDGGSGVDRRGFRGNLQVVEIWDLQTNDVLLGEKAGDGGGFGRERTLGGTPSKGARTQVVERVLVAPIRGGGIWR